MDINYTGCLAVSLYGILIQGCRHNGNPHHGHRCSPAQWREEKKEETCTPGVKREGKELAGRRPLCLLLLVRSCVYSAASFPLSFPCFPSWRSICITLHLFPLPFFFSFLAQFELLPRSTFYELEIRHQRGSFVRSKIKVARCCRLKEAQFSPLIAKILYIYTYIYTENLEHVGGISRETG